jgi:hypothetical protein
VDPATDVAGAQLDPQLWNRYAYAGNGPLSKTDPDGRSWKLATTVVKLAIKGGDIYSTVSDTVHAANIVFSQDEEVTAGDRVLAAGTILADLSGASDLLSIGRTAGRALRVIDDGRGAAKRSTTVYRSVSASGDTQYVGITNNTARRAAEHLRGAGIQIESLMGGLSRSDARAVEQALIEIHGLGRHGGTLLNRIRSISPSNRAYTDQVRRGYELLRTIGYR